MAKYFGKIGYSVVSETAPDVWAEEIVPRSYYGDVLSNNRRWESADGLNDNTLVSNRISIVADPFAYENFSRIRWVEWMGTKWKVSNIEVQYPRIILTLGDVYNENQT